MTLAPAARVQRAFVVALMILATAAMLAGNPLLWVWIGSIASERVAPAGGPLIIVGAGLVAGTWFCAWILNMLSRAYNRAVGADQTDAIRSSANWEAGRYSDPGRHVLSTIVISGFCVAAAGCGVWFLFFAGSSLQPA